MAKCTYPYPKVRPPVVIVHPTPSLAFLGHECYSPSELSVVPCDPEVCGPNGSEAPSPNVKWMEDRSGLKF